MCVRNVNVLLPAIHINSRSWLRSSSIHEPSDPPLGVVLFYICSRYCFCFHFYKKEKRWLLWVKTSGAAVCTFAARRLLIPRRALRFWREISFTPIGRAREVNLPTPNGDRGLRDGTKAS